MVVFNAGLVLGVARGRVNFPGNTATASGGRDGGTGGSHKDESRNGVRKVSPAPCKIVAIARGGGGGKRSGERTLVTATIAITASFILLTLPITIFITIYAKYLKDRCTGRFNLSISMTSSLPP